MNTPLTIAATLAALTIACAWAAGYLTGRSTERRRAAAKTRHPSTGTPQIPDSPATITGHDTCGHDHDPHAVFTSRSLVEANAEFLKAIEPLGVRPAAVIVLVPSPGKDTVTGASLHPSAYPDSADLAEDITRFASEVRGRQGQINADMHRLRAKNGGQ